MSFSENTIFISHLYLPVLTSIRLPVERDIVGISDRVLVVTKLE